MIILVTGAKGFVGRNLVENLKNIRDGKNRTRPNMIWIHRWNNLTIGVAKQISYSTSQVLTDQKIQPNSKLAILVSLQNFLKRLRNITINVPLCSLLQFKPLCLDDLERLSMEFQKRLGKIFFFNMRKKLAPEFISIVSQILLANGYALIIIQQ